MSKASQGSEPSSFKTAYEEALEDLYLELSVGLVGTRLRSPCRIDGPENALRSWQ